MPAGSYERKMFDGGATQASLQSGIDDTQLTLTVATGEGASFPDGSAGKFVIALGVGTGTEEKVLVTSRSADLFTLSTRGYDDTTGNSHLAGVTVDHVLDASTIDQANRFVNLQSNKGDLVAHDGTNAQAVPVGSNDEFLVADSTQTTGVAYKSVSDLNLATTAYVTTAVGDEETARIGDAAIAATDIDITLTGDVTGTGTITNLSDVSFETSIAANSVGSSEIAANAVGSSEIADSAVGTDQLVDLSVTTDKIAFNSINAGRIQDGQVSEQKLETALQQKFPAGSIGQLNASGAYTGSGMRDSTTITVSSPRLLLFIVNIDSLTPWELRISGGGTLVRTDIAERAGTFYHGAVRIYPQQTGSETYELWNTLNTNGYTAFGSVFIIDLGPD
jgi:hypothetical protein